MRLHGKALIALVVLGLMAVAGTVTGLGFTGGALTRIKAQPRTRTFITRAKRHLRTDTDTFLRGDEGDHTGTQ
jgi:hypothetical protein